MSVMAPLEVQILAYLKEHPQASDTIEGISQWWLPGVYHTKSLGEVRAALEHLVSTELICARIDSSGQVTNQLASR